MSSQYNQQQILAYTSGIRILEQQIDGSYKSIKFCFTESHFNIWLIENLELFNFTNPILTLISELNYHGIVWFEPSFLAYRDVFIVSSPNTSNDKKKTVIALKQSELKQKLSNSQKGWQTKF